MKRYLIIFILFFPLIYSCSSDYGKNQKNNDAVVDGDDFKSSKNKDVKKILSSVKNDKLETIIGRSVIFYSMDKKEYNSFLTRMGKQNKWEFDIIYNTFNKTAKNTIPVLKNLKINSKIITNPIVLFLTNTNDSILFDRTSDDYFVGQILFDGRDSLLVEEGLMKSDELEDLIENYFKLKEEINISPVILASDSFRYYKPDTVKVTDIDTTAE